MDGLDHDSNEEEYIDGLAHTNFDEFAIAMAISSAIIFFIILTFFGFWNLMIGGLIGSILNIDIGFAAILGDFVFAILVGRITYKVIANRKKKN